MVEEVRKRPKKAVARSYGRILKAWKNGIEGRTNGRKDQVA